MLVLSELIKYWTILILIQVELQHRSTYVEYNYKMIHNDFDIYIQSKHRTGQLPKWEILLHLVKYISTASIT